MISWGVEISTYLVLPATWYFFRRVFHRNVAGDMLAGTLIGAFNEFATEPLWNYHFHITIYKDVPPSVVMGWGFMFTLVVFASEKIYFWVLKRRTVTPYDKRILLCDLLAGVCIGLPIEAAGLKSGLWNYNTGVLNWNWGTLPFFDMPYEALVGYALFMLIGPTFVRYWQASFEGR